MKNIIIAIDGPAASGKSTIAKEIANILDISYIDSGAMFRAVALYMVNNNIDISNNDKIIENLKYINIDIIDNEIYLNGKNVETDIRENEISNNASRIAVIGEVRELILILQHRLAENKSIIMDGRDIGTAVFPNADYKFFLTASAEERANRRYLESIKNNSNLTLEEIYEDIIKRDYNDSTRELNPLSKAEDAIEIDNTNMTINEVINCIIDYIKEENLDII